MKIKNKIKIKKRTSPRLPRLRPRSKLSRVIVELINTGQELLLGRVLNTHQQWLGRQLADLGHTVSRQVTVPDKGADIQQAVRESLTRADLVITTGGLGPTSDDLTREFIARLLNLPLHEHAPTLAAIEHFFASRNRPMPVSNRVQALVPEGALVLENPNGTAPGLALHVKPNSFRADEKPTWLVMLPGPPRELRPMFSNAVVPLLRRELPVETEFICRTLRTSGVGESSLAERIEKQLAPLVAAGLELGYCAHTWQVDVRLAARGPGAAQSVAEAERVVREQLGSFIFTDQEESLEAVIVRLMTERKLTLALAESCTGGGMAHRITNVPGASAVLLAGLVTYSNAAKQEFLGVKAETLAAHGAVSEAVACEMAEGARRQTGADLALSVTGIAGPDGGSPEKPVGTVFIGLADSTGVRAEKFFNPYDRETFKTATGNQALEKLRRKILAK
ncbi:MAG: competence/damage-inducible protein A [Verrucomicrobia bacterium]|nr:MAG: competence/damage-inducible protein A [Verrucomicrobiota bacterium]